MASPKFLRKRSTILAALRHVEIAPTTMGETIKVLTMQVAEPVGQTSNSAVVGPDRAGRQPSPMVSRRSGRRLIAFGWYGGKFSHLAWLLSLLPRTRQYCEPFAGSAAVLINREPSEVEIYNDIDGEVTNFFMILRDFREELIAKIALTPFSREEFALACEPAGPEVSAIERARRFYVRARQVRFGLAQTASIGRWANCRNTSRAGMAGVVSRWLGGVEALTEIAERLLRVQFENRPAIDVIKLYDDKDTLFYLDPPYPHESRTDIKAYGYEMTDQEHHALADLLCSVKAKVALSGYECPLLNNLYGHWHRHEAPAKQSHTAKVLRQEILWTNY